MEETQEAKTRRWSDPEHVADCRRRARGAAAQKCRTGLARRITDAARALIYCGALTNDSALGLFNEFDYFANLFALRQFPSDRLQRLARIIFRAVDQAEGLLDPLHTFRRKTFPFQAHQIHSPNFRRISVGDHERRNVLNNL